MQFLCSPCVVCFTFLILISHPTAFTLEINQSNFDLGLSLHNTYKIRHLVMRKCGLIKQSKLLKMKSKLLSNLFNEKYGLKLENLTIQLHGTERVNISHLHNPKTVKHTVSLTFFIVTCISLKNKSNVF